MARVVLEGEGQCIVLRTTPTLPLQTNVVPEWSLSRVYTAAGCPAHKAKPSRRSVPCQSARSSQLFAGGFGFFSLPRELTDYGV